MDPSWYGGQNPYTQARMRELKKRELDLSEGPHQAERPPLRAYYTDQGPYGPSKANKPPFESGDVSRSTNSGVKNQDRTPVAGPSSSGRPALKSFYTDQGAYGPGYSTGFGKGETLDKASAGSSKKKLQPVLEEDEGSSSRGDDRPGRPDKGKGKQTGSSSSSKDVGSGSSSPPRQTSTDGDVPGDKARLSFRRVALVAGSSSWARNEICCGTIQVCKDSSIPSLKFPKYNDHLQLWFAFRQTQWQVRWS